MLFQIFLIYHLLFFLVLKNDAVSISVTISFFAIATLAPSIATRVRILSLISKNRPFNAFLFSSIETKSRFS